MSRKKQVNQKITALYCRISLEDGGDNESMLSLIHILSATTSGTRRCCSAITRLRS